MALSLLAVVLAVMAAGPRPAAAARAQPRPAAALDLADGGSGAAAPSTGADDCTPMQVHIALSDDPSKMHVSWRTAGANCPSVVSWWLVREDGGNDAPPGAGDLQMATGFSFLLSERDMCSEPAASNAFSVYLHRAVMTGLLPGGRHRYRLAGGDASWPFRAAAAPGPGGRLTFVAFGDMGDPAHEEAKSPGAAVTLATLQRREMPWLDLVVHVGDVSYADGLPLLWDSFMDAIEPVAARVPYMVTLGNHEYGYDGGSPLDPSGARPYTPSWGNYGADSGGECGTMLARRFFMPGADGANGAGGAGGGAGAPPDNPPFWYTFGWGPVRFVAVSGEHDLSPGSPQHAWLEAALAAADAARCGGAGAAPGAPWLVLLLHRPLYVANPHKPNMEVGEHLRVFVEPLLQRYGVDLAISGHVHTAYRTCEVFRGACVPAAGGRAGDAGPVEGAQGAGAGRAAGQAGGGSGGGSGVSSGSSGGQAGSGGGADGVADSSGSSGVPAPPQRGTVHVVVGSAGHELSGIDPDQEPWLVAAQDGVYGYSRVTAEGGDRLLVEFVAADAGGAGDVLDSFAITRGGAEAARAAACARGAPSVAAS